MTAIGVDQPRRGEAAKARRFAPFHPWDRNFFLLLLAAIWAGILAGFVRDMFAHVTGKHVPFALIVHFHAAVFVGWLVLLTTQMSLIRAGRADLHQRLGVIGLVMIPIMTLLGPATSLVMGHLEFGTPDGDASFIILPIMGMVSFSVIALGGLALRRDPAAHKRLILLATVFISDAGFARWLGGPLSKLLGDGVLPFYAESYFGPVLLVGVMAGYDLVTRRRLHPAFAGAAVFGLTNEVIVAFIYNLPAWKPIATHLIGR
jgi:hypothetical protein